MTAYLNEDTKSARDLHITEEWVSFVLSSTIHQSDLLGGMVTKDEFKFWVDRFGPNVNCNTYSKVIL